MNEGKRAAKPVPADGDPPSARAREAVAQALCAEIQSWGQSQGKAAARLGMHRTALNRILCGDLSRFSLGLLVDIAAIAGLDIELVIQARAEEMKAMPAPHTRDVVPSPAYMREPDIRSVRLAEHCF